MSGVIGFFRQYERYGCFSNWYKCKFKYEGIEFSSTEQFMMYYKAVLFVDTFIADEILKTDDTKRIKALGRQVRDFDEKMWADAREKIMCDGLYAKFSQNDDIKKILLNTGDAILCECSPWDKIWGIGMSTDNEMYKYPSKWKGLNLLGKCLMETREKLRQA